MDMNSHVREAVLEDAPELAELTTQLGYPCDAQQIRQRLQSMPIHDSAILVARDVEGLTGWIHVAMQHSLAADHVAEILGLVVHERCRSLGLGAILLEHAERWASEHGCRQLWVRSNVLRARAHRFYERHGFRRIKTSYTLGKAIGQDI